MDKNKRSFLLGFLIILLFTCGDVAFWKYLFAETLDYAKFKDLFALSLETLGQAGASVPENFYREQYALIEKFLWICLGTFILVHGVIYLIFMTKSRFRRYLIFYGLGMGIGFALAFLSDFRLASLPPLIAALHLSGTGMILLKSKQ